MKYDVSALYPFRIHSTWDKNPYGLNSEVEAEIKQLCFLINYFKDHNTRKTKRKYMKRLEKYKEEYPEYFV